MKYRVLLGGSYDADFWFLRSSFRIWDGPVRRRRCRYYGFRIVVTRRKQ